jgi:hypothetical protein
MRIGLRLQWLNRQGHANFIGEETVALGWQKYLQRRGEQCEIVGPHEPFTDAVDVAIHFHPGMKRDHAKTILYNQNSWTREMVPGGTVGMFIKHWENYDGHIFVSETLQQLCVMMLALHSEKIGPHIVLPFATDPEVFYQQVDKKYAHPIVFVGNDIRGDESNEKYLIPALKKGLVVYGGPFRDRRIQAVHRGRLPQEELPKVYSSAGQLLNFTVPIANECGILAMRVYEVLACQGNLVQADTADCGLTHSDVLACHTWANRMSVLVKWLKEIV